MRRRLLLSTTILALSLTVSANAWAGSQFILKDGNASANSISDQDVLDNNTILKNQNYDGTIEIDTKLTIQENAFQDLMGVQSVGMNSGNNASNTAEGAAQLFVNYSFENNPQHIAGCSTCPPGGFFNHSATGVSDTDQDVRRNKVEVINNQESGGATLNSRIEIKDHAFQNLKGIQYVGINSGNNSANQAGGTAQLFANVITGVSAGNLQEILPGGGAFASVSGPTTQNVTGNVLTVKNNDTYSTVTLDSTLEISNTAFERLRGIQAVGVNSGNNAANSAGQALQLFVNKTNSENASTQTINDGTSQAGVGGSNPDLSQTVNNPTPVTVHANGVEGDATLNSSMDLGEQIFQEIKGVQSIALNSGNNSANAATGLTQLFANVAGQATQSISQNGAMDDFQLASSVTGNTLDVQSFGDGKAHHDTTLTIGGAAFKDIQGAQTIAINTGTNSANSAAASIQMFVNVQTKGS